MDVMLRNGIWVHVDSGSPECEDMGLWADPVPESIVRTRGGS